MTRHLEKSKVLSNFSYIFSNTYLPIKTKLKNNLFRLPRGDVSHILLICIDVFTNILEKNFWFDDPTLKIKKSFEDFPAMTIFSLISS